LSFANSNSGRPFGRPFSGTLCEADERNAFTRSCMFRGAFRAQTGRRCNTMTLWCVFVYQQRTHFRDRETPALQQLVGMRKIERPPIPEVIKKRPREIILSALLRMVGRRRSTSTRLRIRLRRRRVEDVSGSNSLCRARCLMRVVHHHPSFGPHLQSDRPAEIATCAVVSLVSAALMPGYTGQDISGEYAAIAA
jgi:hypothetical protein